MAVSALESLREKSIIVVDSGDIEQLKDLQAQDGTTNPSLLLQAAQLPQYKHLLDDAIAYGKTKGLDTAGTLEEICDRLSVNFGKEILQHVPGVVSTEVDAALSFDTARSIAKAKKIIAMYEEVGIPKDRILIKLATTWEGCMAAKVLESEGIHCNMTLMFSLCQAIAAAEAGATLVSPFVGRILDWHKAKYPQKNFSGSEDPGVKSVTEIYHYYKHFQYSTIVMGASFRNVDEIIALAGCDKLTISPKLLKELQQQDSDVPRRLDQKISQSIPVHRVPMDEPTFRWMLNEDQMATEKLSDGIRVFYADMKKLKEFIQKNM